MCVYIFISSVDSLFFPAFYMAHITCDHIVHVDVYLQTSSMLVIDLIACLQNGCFVYVSSLSRQAATWRIFEKGVSLNKAAFVLGVFIEKFLHQIFFSEIIYRIANRLYYQLY